MEPNEIDKFFDELPTEDKQVADIFDEIVGAKNESTVEETGKEGTDPEKEDEPRKNRRHRRLEEQLQKEREENIRLKALAEGRSESAKFAAASTDVPAEWLQMYGDSPETRQAWALQEKLFDRVRSETKAETIREIEQKEQARIQEVAQFEQMIDDEFESIEDEYNVDLTSNAPAAKKARREYIDLLQKLSPKNDKGEVTSYADFGSVWEIYAANRTKEKDPAIAAKQKELADRSMANKGGSGTGAAPTITPGFRGWMKDLNLNN